MRAKQLLLYDMHGNGNGAKIHMFVVRNFEGNRGFAYLETAQVKIKLADIVGILNNFQNRVIGNRPCKFEIGIIRRVNLVAMVIQKSELPQRQKCLETSFF